MAPRVPALAQSDTKAKLFERLGLDLDNATHRRVYQMMKTEAATARRRILEGQDTSTAQVHEAAWAREVLRIYQDARPETKAVYQFGHDLQTGDNWIIRWVMWHVFRYRDYRNKGRPSRNAATASLSPSTTDEEEHDPAPTNGASPVSSSANGVPGGDVAAAVRAAGEAPHGDGVLANQYWDPIRERWQS